MAVLADVFNAECGTRTILSLLADKWTGAGRRAW
jgi:hypothetical protein